MAGRLVKREAGEDLKGSEREEFIDFSFDVDGRLIVVDQQGFFEAECRVVTGPRDDLGFEGGAAVHSVLKHTRSFLVEVFPYAFVEATHGATDVELQAFSALQLVHTSLCVAEVAVGDAAVFDFSCLLVLLLEVRFLGEVAVEYSDWKVILGEDGLYFSLNAIIHKRELEVDPVVGR